MSLVVGSEFTPLTDKDPDTLTKEEYKALVEDQLKINPTASYYLALGDFKVEAIHKKEATS